MRTLVIFTAAALGLMVGGQAMAADQYVSVSAGSVEKVDYSYTDVWGSDYESEFDSGKQFSVAYGRRYNKLRGEIALTSRSQDIVRAVRRSGGGTYFNTLNGEVKALVLDLNVYYDFPVEGRFRPYVGAGAGVADLTIDDEFINDKASVLNLQAMVGVNVEITKNFDFYAEARTQRLGSFTIETSDGTTSNETDIDLTSTGVLGGIKFKF